MNVLVPVGREEGGKRRREKGKGGTKSQIEGRLDGRSPARRDGMKGKERQKGKERIKVWKEGDERERGKETEITGEY